jgi:hypothetical protein
MFLQSAISSKVILDPLAISKELGIASDDSARIGPLYPLKVDDTEFPFSFRRSIIENSISELNTAIVDCNFSVNESREISRFSQEATPFGNEDAVIKMSLGNSHLLVEDLKSFFSDRGFISPELTGITTKISQAVHDLAYGLYKHRGQFDFCIIPTLTPLHSETYHRFLNAEIVGDYHTHHYSLAVLHLNLPGPCYIFERDVNHDKFQEYCDQTTSIRGRLWQVAHQLESSPEATRKEHLFEEWIAAQRAHVQFHQNPSFLKNGGHLYQLPARMGMILSEDLYHRSPFLLEYDLNAYTNGSGPLKRFFIDIVGV